MLGATVCCQSCTAKDHIGMIAVLAGWSMDSIDGIESRKSGVKGTLGLSKKLLQALCFGQSTTGACRILFKFKSSM